LTRIDVTRLCAFPAVDSISDREDGAAKVGRKREVDRQQQPKKKPQREERSAREAEETGDAEHHVILNLREEMTTVEIGFNCSGGL
jgi:hypothetical protein